MKLDSEEQREQLLKMLSSVRVTSTTGQLQSQLDEYHRIIKPVMRAGIEVEKPVVPIEFLAPDTPGHVRRFVGMPGSANGGE